MRHREWLTTLALVACTARGIGEQGVNVHYVFGLNATVEYEVTIEDSTWRAVPDSGMMTFYGHGPVSIVPVQ